VRLSDKKQTRFMPPWVGNAGGRLRRNRFSIKLRFGLWHGKKHHEKAGAPSFALFAKGGIGDGRYRDSWYPTLRKKREGWGTRGLVALSAEDKKSPFHITAGRQRRWATLRKAA
jgi:hypothetical protein